MSLDYSIVSLTRPPSFLFRFRKTIEVSGEQPGHVLHLAQDLDMEKLLGIRDVYMKTVMSSNYKGDIFYTRDQVEQAIRSAYTDTESEILSDYRGDRLQRALHCCYDNLSREIVLPGQVILDYITPANQLEELVFVSRSDIGR